MKLVIGNQKAYINRDAVLDFIEKTKSPYCKNAIICPSYIYIDLYLDKSEYMVGAQNVSCKGNGASTGEITAEQLIQLLDTLKEEQINMRIAICLFKKSIT